MCLTSNYNRKEWSSLCILLLVKVVLPFCGALFIAFTFVIPMFEVMVEATPTLADERIVVAIRDMLWDKGFNLSTILVYLILTVSGALVISFLFMIFSMIKLMDLAHWLTKRMELKDLLLYWNGVRLEDTRLGKKFKSKTTKL